MYVSKISFNVPLSSFPTGESNIDNNREYYACTFSAMIEHWRLLWARHGTELNLPFGFVQLANVIGGWQGVEIRWHQTFDKGYVDGTVNKKFMAVSMDTFDEEGGLHPRLGTKKLQD